MLTLWHTTEIFTDMKRYVSLFFALAVTVTLFAADKVRTTFTVTPAMVCENCENKIKSNLRFEKGVKAIETSLKDQTVAIEYDPDKTSIEKFESAFKKIGYDASIATEAAPKCPNATQRTCCKSKSNCTGPKKNCTGHNTKCPSK